MDLEHKEKSWPKSQHGSASRATGVKEKDHSGELVDGLEKMWMASSEFFIFSQISRNEKEDREEVLGV